MNFVNHVSAYGAEPLHGWRAFNEADLGLPKSAQRAQICAPQGHSLGGRSPTFNVEVLSHLRGKPQIFICTYCPVSEIKTTSVGQSLKFRIGCAVQQSLDNFAIRRLIRRTIGQGSQNFDHGIPPFARILIGVLMQQTGNIGQIRDHPPLQTVITILARQTTDQKMAGLPFAAEEQHGTLGQLRGKRSG